jgi:FMN phosphatase YigB (HAD superfamily)
LNNTEVKNIIFDLGNTLVYYDYCYFYDGVATLEKNFDIDSFQKFITDNKLDVQLWTGKITVKNFFKKLKKKFKLKISFADFHYLYCDIFWENTEMKDFIENNLIDSTYKVFLLSNTDSSHINYIHKNFPFVKLLKNRVLSYKVKTLKPEKKIFRHIIGKFDLKAKESVLIDDLKVNIIAASQLGMKTIHYTSHKRFLKEFKKLTKGNNKAA